MYKKDSSQKPMYITTSENTIIKENPSNSGRNYASDTKERTRRLMSDSDVHNPRKDAKRYDAASQALGVVRIDDLASERRGAVEKK